MKFCYLRSEQVCFYCHNIIKPGEEVVVVRIYHKTANQSYPQFFHTDQCYEKWNHENYVKRLLEWRLSATPQPQKKKRGRPRKYWSRVQSQRLLSLLAYHKSLNHPVDHLERQLEELKI